MLLVLWVYFIIFLIGCIVSVLLDIINSRSFSIFVLLAAFFTPSWVNDWFIFEGSTSEFCLTLLKNKILKWKMTCYYISWLGFICYSILFVPFSSGFCLSVAFSMILGEFLFFFFISLFRREFMLVFWSCYFFLHHFFLLLR